MALDRKLAPAFRSLDKIQLLDAQSGKLSNSIPLYTIFDDEHKVIRIDLLFDAGDWKQQKPLVASVCVNMLAEGSEHFSAVEIAEKLDFLGSYVSYSTQKHTACISLHCMSKYFDESMRIVADLVLRPRFSPQELSIYLAKRKQQYIVDDSRVEVRSQKLFSQAMFGAMHPYGLIPQPSDYDEVTPDDLRLFHSSNYVASNCTIVMAGCINESHTALVDELFGGLPFSKSSQNEIIPMVSPSVERRLYEQRTDAVQTSLRIGKPFVIKTHPDFSGLQVLNTVLGGYFGSRLMQNIREDKGFTYGIGSGVLSNRHAGYFTIVTEVGKSVRQAAIDEIHKEINRLCVELVSDEELQLVKNYMIATTLRNFDGVFATVDSLKAILDYNVTIQYYYDFLQTVQQISAPQLRDLAQKYWADGDFWEISVG